MDKNKGKKTYKTKLLNGSIVVAFVAALVVFMVMLQLEKKVLTEYEKAFIFVAAENIPKGQMITADNYQNYLIQKELDSNCVPETAVKEVQDVKDLIAVFPIEKGVLLTKGMFVEKNEVTAEMEHPVIAGFKAEDMYQVVGGVLRAGDRIHIYNVDEEGAAHLTWSNIFVEAVFDNAGAVIANDNTTTSATRINIYMDNTDIEQFYSELANGSLRAVKICE